MRRTLLGLAAATLALTALPALAADGPVLAACDAVAGAQRLNLAGLSTTVAGPLTPSPTLAAAPIPRTGPDATTTYLLDLAGQPVGTTAGVGAVLTWGQFVNDFDLRLSSGEGRAASQEVNPTSMSAQEQTALGGLGHCAVLTVGVQNYLAGPDTLTLKLTPEIEVPEDVEE